MGVNKIILVGNLGNDPELRQTNGGQDVANFRLAVTEKFKLKGGDLQERTDWFSVVVWGNQALAVANNLTKGRQVYIEGRINERSYQDKDGNERKVWDVTASNVTFLSSADRGGQGNSGSRGGNNGGGWGGNNPNQGNGGGWGGNSPNQGNGGGWGGGDSSPF